MLYEVITPKRLSPFDLFLIADAAIFNLAVLLIHLVDSVVASLENAFVRYYESCTLPERNGNAYASLAPCDSYEAQDGYVV